MIDDTLKSQMNAYRRDVVKLMEACTDEPFVELFNIPSMIESTEAAVSILGDVVRYCLEKEETLISNVKAKYSRTLAGDLNHVMRVQDFLLHRAIYFSASNTLFFVLPLKREARRKRGYPKEWDEWDDPNACIGRLREAYVKISRLVISAEIPIYLHCTGHPEKLDALWRNFGLSQAEIEENMDANRLLSYDYIIRRFGDMGDDATRDYLNRIDREFREAQGDIGRKLKAGSITSADEPIAEDSAKTRGEDIPNDGMANSQTFQSYQFILEASERAALSDRERKAFELVYLNGENLNKAAEKMGVEIPTVQTYVNRSLVKIKAMLDIMSKEFDA